MQSKNFVASKRFNTLLAPCIGLLIICAGNAQAYCFNEAATEYSVPALMLKAIAKTESGMNSDAIGPRNANGSHDIGLMQINSSHLGYLARYGINQEKLVSDPCLNVKVGAWILQKNFLRYGQTLRAIGAYNAGDETKRAIYAAKVLKNYQLLANSNH